VAVKEASSIHGGNGSGRPSGVDYCTVAFYRASVGLLQTAGIPFLVGGAYALTVYTGIARHTKDIDLFLRREDSGRAIEAFTAAGFEAELLYPHWLGKAYHNDHYCDLIFSSGNGVAAVDDEWFQHAAEARVFGRRVLICAPEEMIWSKAFIMERERYDGADILHLFLSCGRKLDWERLLRRFDGFWRVLLSHLVLFGFVYPGRRDVIPRWVMSRLIERLEQEERESVDPQVADLCRGTILSRAQYLPDLEQGFRDARLVPLGNMTAGETAIWTAAIEQDEKGRAGPADEHTTGAEQPRS
jgi:hypothetical protein